ncbi:hypothetical protein NX784_20830 [Massilia pinisoli]|uniref:Lipoprotein n=1 Tax=Massilia pinisoli TaxID=1772194 RepID=A0ABT1ZVU3_9BURK|nr:hypothetical protein [Massilia pinisoli]MCS0584047.1 hypothetical protein [Massilia pinisoli]
MTTVDIPILGPIHRRLAFAACFALLAACSRHEPPAPPSSQPAAAAVAPPQALDGERSPEIMRAIFGAACDAAGKSAHATVKVDGADTGVVMTLVSAAALPDGRVAAIVNGEPEFASHGSAGILNVYLLRRAQSGWTVVQRHTNAAQLGPYGNIGSATWVALGTGRPGFILSWGDMGQGYSIDLADVFEIGNGIVHRGQFKEGSSNGGACTPEEKACWTVEGHMRLAPDVQPGGYRDILIDFTGKRYTLSEGKDGTDVEHVTENVRQTARYRFDGKAYALTAGTNPVPDI